MKITWECSKVNGMIKRPTNDGRILGIIYTGLWPRWKGDRTGCRILNKLRQLMIEKIYTYIYYLSCIKTFHSKRDNSHWCQNFNQLKYVWLFFIRSLLYFSSLSHHCLPLSQKLLSPILSTSLSPNSPLSASFYCCQNFNLLKFLDNHS